MPPVRWVRWHSCALTPTTDTVIPIYHCTIRYKSADEENLLGKCEFLRHAKNKKRKKQGFISAGGAFLILLLIEAGLHFLISPLIKGGLNFLGRCVSNLTFIRALYPLECSIIVELVLFYLFSHVQLVCQSVKCFKTTKETKLID